MKSAGKDPLTLEKTQKDNFHLKIIQLIHGIFYLPEVLFKHALFAA
jgi:hypothetical protein